MSEYNQPVTSASVMVVDDTPDNLRLLASILTHGGYEVRPVRSGRLAIEAAQASPPDLFLLDIMMPDLDGYEVCEQLKANKRTRHIPIIFISALDSIEDKVKSFNAGGVDYITKPFQSEEVLARVNTHITIHRLEQNLREQIAELDAFSHTVAHDLKNPLAYMISMADLIVAQYREQVPEELVDFLKKIQSSGYRLLDIIDELMLLSSVRKQNVQLSPINMRLTVIEAKERLRLLIEDHQAEIVAPDKWPLALGYAPWVVEVWVNYLSNGLKYGGDPPRLVLGSTALDDGLIRFWVQDNGPGISAEKQAVLFTEFVRLNELDIQGYGLGLSIVLRIMKRLNGRVGVESDIGQGSTFYFDLPAFEQEAGPD